MRLPFVSSRYSHHCSSIKFQHPSLALFCSSSRRPPSPRMESTAAFRRSSRKEKMVVIMGATGTGKSRLSIDLAIHFPFLEIINSDKMQVYRGLDITTNKIPIDKRNGVVHHLLGEVDPEYGEFTALDFRLRGSSVISDITSRKKLPIVVGGSNSFIHALLADRFNPDLDVFDGLSLWPSPAGSLISSELRYKCCFLWVDVSFPVLSDYLRKRVDEMLDLGMVDELAEFFDPDSDDDSNRIGLRKAIGVPEFDRYFKKHLPPGGLNREGSGKEDLVQKAAYEEAVRAIEDNTCQLVKRQNGKILQLKAAGWDMRRVDATEAFREAMAASRGGGERWLETWEREVVEPSVKIVRRFLRE